MDTLNNYNVELYICILNAKCVIHDQTSTSNAIFKLQDGEVTVTKKNEARK